MGVSTLHRLFLSDHELAALADKYGDRQDMSRVEWKSFETDTEKGILIFFYAD